MNGSRTTSFSPSVLYRYQYDAEGHLRLEGRAKRSSRSCYLADHLNGLPASILRYREGGFAGIPADPLVRYMDEAAGGIDFLNGQGIYHRNIKPQNLLFFHGHVKLADLGFGEVRRGVDRFAHRLGHTGLPAAGKVRPALLIETRGPVQSGGHVCEASHGLGTVRRNPNRRGSAATGRPSDPRWVATGPSRPGSRNPGSQA